MPLVSRLAAVFILLACAAPASAEALFETKAICRAAIAAIMDRDPKLLQVTEAADGVIWLTYTRPFDNFVFSYRCRLESDRVFWADEPGCWRDGAKDNKVFFEIIGANAQIRITVNRIDGTTTREIFDRDKVL